MDLSASLARMDAAAARAANTSRLDRIIARQQREMAAEREQIHTEYETGLRAKTEL